MRQNVFSAAFCGFLLMPRRPGSQMDRGRRDAVVLLDALRRDEESMQKLQI
jgi:hypothetical protein